MSPLKPGPELPRSIRSVLFVCTGNSCRSVIAEGFFKKMLKGLGREINVSSAGTSAFPMGATDETLKVLAEEGVDMKAHRSRCVTKPMLEEADVIFVMQSAHRDFLNAMLPHISAKIFLLSDFYPEQEKVRREGGIPDPIGRGFSFYKTTAAMIRKCLEAVAHAIEEPK